MTLEKKKDTKIVGLKMTQKENILIGAVVVIVALAIGVASAPSETIMALVAFLGATLLAP